jgi:hypothetical protein
VGTPEEDSQRFNDFGREPDPEYDPATAAKDYEILQRNKAKRETLEQMFPDPHERMQYCMRVYAGQNSGNNLPASPHDDGDDDESDAQQRAESSYSPPKKKTPVSGMVDTLKGKKGPLAWLLGMTAIPLAGAAIFTAFTFGSPAAIGAYAVYAAGCMVCSHMVGYENPNRKQEYLQKALIGLSIGVMIGQKIVRGVKKLLGKALFLGAVAAGVLVAGGIAGAVAGPVVGAGVIIGLGSLGLLVAVAKLTSMGAPIGPQQAPQRAPQGQAPVGQQRSMSQDYNSVSTNDNDTRRREDDQEVERRRLQRNEFIATNGQAGAPTF